MSAPASPRAPLWNAGFLSLLATQFFEAATDNLIKTSLTLAVAAGKPWEQVLGKGGGGIIGVVFTLPFILFSAWAGRLADRRSKRTITVVLKVVSFGVAALALVGFGLGHPWVAFGALVLFATVSAFFGPAKYGMIAELVDPGEIARANGVVNMATNVAVIAGTLLAGVVSDRWDAAFEDGLPAGAGAWLPGGAVGVLVVLGFLTCLTLPRLRAQDPGLPVRWNPFDTYVATLRLMARGPLLAVALLWTFFYFVAAVVLLVLPDYSEFLHVSNTAVGELMGILGIAIGAGCVAAAWLDRASRRRLFVPAGAIGLAASFLALGLAPAGFAVTGALLAVGGIAAGFFIIPLQSLLQILSPDAERGRCLGTANGMSFVMGGLGAVLFWALRHADVPSQRIFLVLAACCALVAPVAWRRLRGLATA
jgi:acyl-[acyl-carrier-protein]-phospholipid O-acyltransferase/long-chain-fatty-acid--[acyl-carrier-protein] ligase